MHVRDCDVVHACAVLAQLRRRTTEPNHAGTQATYAGDGCGAGPRVFAAYASERRPGTRSRSGAYCVVACCIPAQAVALRWSAHCNHRRISRNGAIVLRQDWTAAAYCSGSLCSVALLIIFARL